MAEDNTTEIEVVDAEYMLQDNQKDLSVQPARSFDVMAEFSSVNITPGRLAGKINQLLDAQTLSATGEVIEDNMAQLQALKLALKIANNESVGDGARIAIFNNIPRNGPLKY